MLSKIIVCISAKQATVGLWRMGRFVSCTIFMNGQAGQDKFSLFLRSHSSSPIHVIVDTVEEDFRLETLPHSNGKARHEMLQRKLTQLYRNSDYRTAQIIGREADKRRDDRIMFMALVNSELLSPWMSAIEEQGLALAGVYLQPMVSQLMLQKLKLKHTNLLVMTRQSSGLRQSYFSNQSLRLSRLTPLAGLDEEKIDRLYLSETERTRLYLISLRMLAREAPLNLVYLASNPITNDFSQIIEATQGVMCDIIQPQKIAKKIGLSTDLLTRYPDLLHMQVLATSRISSNLASEAKTKNYRLLQIQLGINIASAVSIAVAALLAFSSLLSTADIKRQTEVASTQTFVQENLYKSVSINFPETPIPGSELKVAVELAQKFDSLNQTPLRLMQIVSGALEPQPELVINRLRWKQTENAKFVDDAPSIAKASTTPGQPAQLTPPKPSSGLYEIGFVSGEIQNFTGDYRTALANVERFVEALKKNKDVAQVTVVQQPVNTSSKVTLSGNTLDDNTNKQEPAYFIVKLFIKPIEMLSKPKTAGLAEGKS